MRFPGMPPTVFMMATGLTLPSREQVERGVAVVPLKTTAGERCELKTTSLLAMC